MSEWFVNWFDSPYYHQLYKHRDEQDAAIFLDNLLKTISLPINATVLDLCCGTGRHAIYLNKLGHNVLGIDLSPKNIQIAQQLHYNGLTFQVGDMRNLPFQNHFDLIINLFTSFGYFQTQQENIQVLHQIAKALKPNGIFILDFLNPTLTKTTLTPYCEIQVDDIQYIIKKKIMNNFIFKEIEVQHNNQKHLFEERIHLFEYQDFLTIFNQLNLTIKSLWGDYHTNQYIETQSDRLIFVLRK